MNPNEFQFNRVMIVDDTKIDRYIASHVLRKHQFAREVLEFDMAKKAIDFLTENHDRLDLLPEVILLDIRMPEMDGFQFLEALSLLPKSLKQSCCIIMLSSSLDPVDHERAEKSNVIKKFINKPLKKENFEEIVNLYNSVSVNKFITE